MKAAIDRKLDAGAKKPFARFNAYIREYIYCGGQYQLVEITSATDKPGEFWAVSYGRRIKVENIYLHNTANEVRVAEIHKRKAQIKTCQKEISEISARMEPWTQL